MTIQAVRQMLELRLGSFMPMARSAPAVDPVISTILVDAGHSGAGGTNIALIQTQTNHGLLPGDILFGIGSGQSLFNVEAKILTTPELNQFTYQIAMTTSDPVGSLYFLPVLLSSNLGKQGVSLANEQSIPYDISNTPFAETAYENVTFLPRTPNMWQRSTFMPAQPVDYAGSDQVRKYVGLLAVNIFGPNNSGPGAVENRAACLLALFSKGLIIRNSDGIAVRMTGSYTKVANNDGTWYNIPVWIPWFSYI